MSNNSAHFESESDSVSETGIQRYPSLLKAKHSCSSRNGSITKEQSSVRSEKSIELDSKRMPNRSNSLLGPKKTSCFKDQESEFLPLKELILEADESDTLSEKTPHYKLMIDVNQKSIPSNSGDKKVIFLFPTLSKYI